MSSVWGNLFRVSTYGESHGPCVGAIVDGCPSRMPLEVSDIQRQMDRRRPGQSALTTPRKEADQVRILSGVENGLTLGTPIALQMENTDVRPRDYVETNAVPRPSHADFTYKAKYGIVAGSGGGRASARETAARVAAGAVAEKFLGWKWAVEIVAWVSAIGDVQGKGINSDTVSRQEVDQTAVRCPDLSGAREMIQAIETVRAEGDSVGGVVTCVCRNVPPGWGEPVFDKMGAVLASAMLSIPAARGFEIGLGFSAARMRGSEHNDVFVKKQRGGREVLGTATNHSGGIQGGITNGEPILFRVAFKAPATISKLQRTADYGGNTVEFSAAGRHDPCVAPRAVPVVEAMTAIVLADMALQATANGNPREI